MLICLSILFAFKLIGGLPGVNIIHQTWCKHRLDSSIPPNRPQPLPPLPPSPSQSESRQNSCWTKSWYTVQFTCQEITYLWTISAIIYYIYANANTNQTSTSSIINRWRCWNRCEDTSGGEPPRKAVKSCLHCNASYCDRCLKMSHPGRAPFSEHKMVEPRKHTRPKELRCLDHDALMNIYCRDCQTLGCILCADDTGIHAGHQVLSLRQTVEWLKVIIRYLMQYLTTHVRSLDRKLHMCNTLWLVQYFSHLSYQSFKKNIRNFRVFETLHGSPWKHEKLL